MIGYKIKDPATGRYAPSSLNLQQDRFVEDGALFKSEQTAKARISRLRNEYIGWTSVWFKDYISWLNTLVIVKVERKDVELG